LQQRTVYTSIELKSTGYVAAHPAYPVATPMRITLGASTATCGREREEGDDKEIDIIKAKGGR
jgi:hypothetical protein